jgi:AraC-like DNA-binding protein
MQVTPSPELATLVKHYLIIENQPQQIGTYRFFPDGHPGLVYSYAEPLVQHDNYKLAPGQLPIFVYGQANRYHNLGGGKKIGLLIVVFQPWGLYAITGVPGVETTNRLLSLDNLFGPEGNTLLNQLQACSDNPGRIKRIEDFLRKRLHTVTHGLTQIQTAVQLIYQTNGSKPIGHLTQQLSITERSLERGFNKVIGMGPKQFARIIRLQHGLKVHREQPDLNLTELTYLAGYYDQAHFIREFTHLVGSTPSQYQASTQRLAVNLLPLST